MYEGYLPISKQDMQERGIKHRFVRTVASFESVLK